jgi:hypothetical protein
MIPRFTSPGLRRSRVLRTLCLAVLGTLFAAGSARPAPAAAAPAAPPSAAQPEFLPDSTVVATFDGRNITAHEFVVTWFAADPAGRPTTDSLGRAQFLTSMIQKEILGAAARKVGYNLGYEGRVQLREYTQRELGNILFQRAVVDSVVITEADVQHVYGQLSRAVHLRRILFANRALADKVRLDLKAGRIRWSDAVKRYSKATDARGPEGDFGWVVRTSLDYDLGELVFGLKPGEISPVFEDATGPQVVQCLEDRTISAPALESVRKTIVRQIEISRTEIYAERMQTVLSNAIGFRPDSANINWASVRFPDSRQVGHEEGTTTLSLNASDPDIPEQDTSRVLARWKDGKISLGQFLSHYTAINPLLRPPAHTPGQLTAQVANVVLEPYKEQVAIERGYDKDPMLVAAVEKRHERLLVERMYTDSILTHISLTKEDRQQEYDAHRADYVQPEERTFATIMRRSQGAADSLVAELKAGKRAQDVLAADSAAGARTGMIHVMKATEHGPFRKIVFEEMKAGDITTTPGADGSAAVIQLIRVTPERTLTFEEARPAIEDAVEAHKAEELFQALIKRLSRGHTFTTHPELLIKVRLVDPVA